MPCCLVGDASLVVVTLVLVPLLLLLRPLSLGWRWLGLGLFVPALFFPTLCRCGLVLFCWVCRNFLFCVLFCFVLLLGLLEVACYMSCVVVVRFLFYFYVLSLRVQVKGGIVRQMVGMCFFCLSVVV